MGGSGSNFNQMVRDSVPDQGFPFTQDIFNILRGHTGLLLTLSTTPKNVLTSDYLTAQWDAASTATAYAKAFLPPTLAFQSSQRASSLHIPYPRVRVHMRLRMAGATDNPRITVTAKLRASGGAIKTLFTPTSMDGTVANYTSGVLGSGNGTTLTDGTCAPLANPTNPDLRTWDFYETSGTGPVYIAPGDYMDIKIVPGTHGTDAIELHGATLAWHQNANYTTISQRT